MGRMSGLATAFASGPAFVDHRLGLGFFAEIAGRRLGRISRILFEGSDLGFERGQLSAKLLHQKQKRRASGAPRHPCRRHNQRVYSTAAKRASEVETA